MEELIEVLAEGHAFADGEELDLLAHHLQCAAILAQEDPHDVELQLAGLLHDVGTQLVPDAPDEHAGIAARVIRPLLGERVAMLIGYHVDAKRYLVTTDPSYRDQLSEMSRYTLGLQGDKLDAAAVSALEADPDREAILQLRRADDRAKVPGLSVPGLDRWTPLLHSRSLCS